MKPAQVRPLLLLLLAACSTQEQSGPETGSLTITVSGLNTPAAITVTGPSGFTQEVTGTSTIPSLAVGSYTISAQAVVVGGADYAAEQPSLTVEVTASSTAEATVLYRRTGPYGFVLSVSGLPDGVGANITVTGPSFAKAVTASGTVTIPGPGTYTIAATNTVVGGHPYAPTPASATITVTDSTVPVAAPFSYREQDIALQVTVSGLPAGALADISVSGPLNFLQHFTGTTALHYLIPGTYIISSGSVLLSDRTWRPALPLSRVDVSAPDVPVAIPVAYAMVSGATVTVSSPVTLLFTTETTTLSATVQDALGPLLGRRTWRSDNPAVAAVDSTGRVSAIGEGVATITVTAEGASGSAVITVNPRTPVSLSGGWTLSFSAAGTGRDAALGCSGNLQVTVAAASPDSVFDVAVTGPGRMSCSSQTLHGTVVAFTSGVVFRFGSCTFAAGRLAPPVDHLSGRAVCIVSNRRTFNGTVSTTGRWEATRTP